MRQRNHLKRLEESVANMHTELITPVSTSHTGKSQNPWSIK